MIRVAGQMFDIVTKMVREIGGRLRMRTKPIGAMLRKRHGRRASGIEP